MTSLVGLSLWAAAAWCFGLTVTSAVLPWVNAEVIVMALPAVATSAGALMALVAVATVGQMAGKCVVYWAARRGTRTPAPALEHRLAPWRRRVEGHTWSSAGLVLVSSIAGLPPFYLITMLAGAARMNFLLYLAAGTIGRLIRFGTILAGALALAR